jgi:hypothetical protein
MFSLIKELQISRYLEALWKVFFAGMSEDSIAAGDSLMKSKPRSSI